MEQYKRAQVIMLPSSKISNIYLNIYADNKNKADKLVHADKIEKSSIYDLKSRGYEPQELYIISDDKIKELPK
mgnify:CR=1 FL=1